MNFDTVSRQLLSRIMLYNGEIRCDDALLQKEHCATKIVYRTMFCTWRKDNVRQFDTLYSGIDVNKAIDEFIDIVGSEKATQIALNWFRERKQKEKVINV